MTVTQKIQAAITAINQKTGKSDTTLTAGIQSLLDGGTPEEVSPVSSGVNFYDYDGRCVAAWTAAEALTKTALPPAPDHTGDVWHGESVGLTSRGWSVSLANIQAAVGAISGAEADFIMNVGHYYITDDGDTRLFVRIDPLLASPCVAFGLDGTALIDWGDGTDPDTVTGEDTSVLTEATHTYAAGGEYCIRISGNIMLKYAAAAGSGLLCRSSADAQNNNAAYQKAVFGVQLGNASLGSYAFRGLGLEWISQLPGACVGEFYECHALKSIIYAGANYMAYYCRALKTVCLSDAAFSDSSTGNECFRSCESLIVPPPVMAEIAGTKSFKDCYAASRFVIGPGVLTLNAQAFENGKGLRALVFCSSQPPTAASTSVFSGLTAECVIYVPQGALNAYRTATNYPNPNTFTYMEV